MNLIFSTDQEDLYSKWFSSESQKVQFTMIPAMQFLQQGECQNLSASFYIWLYRAPWYENITESQFNLWLTQQRRALQLKKNIGEKLIFINIDRVSAKDFLSYLGIESDWNEEITEIQHCQERNILASHLNWFAPQYWDVLESLELMSCLPQGEEPWQRNTIPNPTPELFTQLLALLNTSKVELPELQSNLAEKQKKLEKITTENQLLLSQLHQVQEGLEQQYLQYQSQENQVNQLNLTLVFHKQEKEQLVQQLAEIKKNVQELSKELQKKQEIEKTASSVESKISNNEVEQENKLLLQQLHLVQEELEIYYLENVELRKGSQLQQGSKNNRSYGASEYVKALPAYQLGATMINHSRSFSGWIKMRRAVKKQFWQLSQQYATNHFPSIEKYADAFRAEQIKKHLSYRLGTIWIDSQASLGGRIKLPFRLLREIRLFRQEKNKK